MIEITEMFVDSLAPNSAAIKNGQGLVKKGKFLHLHKSEDDVVLFGECSGSGSSNYYPSADFVVQEKPVMRCTCPSRQLPCKHVLGLLYAYVNKGAFNTAAIPEDLAAKREKAEKREERKAQQAEAGTDSKPKKTNTAALKKKITAQLEGLDVLEKLLQSVIRTGLGTIDKKALKDMEAQVKQLGNYYLTGAQVELRRLVVLLSSTSSQEELYTLAVEQLSRMHALIKKGRAHLAAKLETPAMALDHESTIEEWLGHAWQLTELKELGLMTENAELIQLSFFSYNDEARQEYVDVGYWIEKSTGDIHRTIQYRPYKAAKFIREDDSFFEAAVIPSLYRYPGDLNRRVRFDEMTTRPITQEDLNQIAACAQRSYTEAIKLVKNQVKNLLADKNPVLLLHAAEVNQTEHGDYVMVDESGQQLALGYTVITDHDALSLLSSISSDLLTDAAMLVMFEHQLDTGRLVAQPLTILKGSEIIRLLY
ncbi:SWIM zinc finger family protein [Paenibacillus marinisediminis]